MNMFGVEVS